MIIFILIMAFSFDLDCKKFGCFYFVSAVATHTNSIFINEVKLHVPFFPITKKVPEIFVFLHNESMFSPIEKMKTFPFSFLRNPVNQMEIKFELYLNN